MYLFYEDYIQYITIDTDNNITNNTKEYKLIERKDNTKPLSLSLSLSVITLDNNEVRIREDQMSRSL